MKYIIASDIHGSLFYTEKLLSSFEKEGASRLLLLGDTLYHGPRNPLPEGYNPGEVAESFVPYKDVITAVRGNCDSEVDEMVLPFHTQDTSCIIETPTLSLFLTHGHVYNENNLPPLKKGTVILSGHTHIPVVDEWAGFAHLNPGSVSLPKNNSHSGYILLENRTFVLKDFEGNVKKVFTF